MIKEYISKITIGLLTIGFGIVLATAPVSALGEGGAPAGIARHAATIHRPTWLMVIHQS